MKKVKLAYIGTGGIAQRHLKSVQNRKDTDVVGLCDIDKNKLVATIVTGWLAQGTDGERP